jgi:putative transposase
MYHVTLRGNHQQDIFFSPADRSRMSDLFAEVIARFDARLHAYCYMTNHLHVLIQVSDVPLGRLILRIAGQYARMTQARLLTTGHLFEKRYHPVLVDTDTYLLELIRYIHLNPVRAGLASHPSAYPWTSHHAYLGQRDEPWVTTDFALSLLAPVRGKAIAAYERFVHLAPGLESARSPLDERNPNDPRILGGDDFARRMLGDEWKPRSQKSLQELVEDACRHFAVSVAQMRSGSREPKLVAARAWVTNEAVQGRVATVSAVARAFNRNESSLRRALRSRFSGD